MNAPWIAALDLQVLNVRAAPAAQLQLRLPVSPQLIHVGGAMCGQAAMMAELGEFRPMTTVQMQSSFLRPIGAEHGLITTTYALL